jgi:hypothetical protein
MAPILKVLLEFLRAIRFAKGYIKRFPGCATSLLAFLGRKLKLWWRFWLGKLGSFGSPKPAERPVLGSEASSYSASGGSTVVMEYVVAASSVPVSASNPSIHKRLEASSGQTVSVDPPVVASPSVGHLHAPSPISSHTLGGRSLVNRSSESRSPNGVNIQSRASDRFLIITNSRKSTGAPSGQPSQLFKETHSRGPDRSPREGGSDPHTPPHASDPKIIIPFPTHGDDNVGGQDVDSDVQNLSLSISSSTNPRQLADQPFAIDPARVHPFPGPLAVDRHHEPLQGIPMSSNAVMLDHFVPEGRLVRLIDSEQFPRYTKDIKM